MTVDGTPFRTIWVAEDGETVEIIDQTRLPHAFEVIRLVNCDDAARAIISMQVRGAPLIGATAAYGLCLALRDDPSDAALAGDNPRRNCSTRSIASRKMSNASSHAWISQSMLILSRSNLCR